MAFASTKIPIVSRKIQTELAEELTLAKGCNTEFEGEAKRNGEVTIVGLARPTIFNYTGPGSIPNPEEVDDSNLKLKLDQAKGFNVYIDDIDAAFAAREFKGLMIDEAKTALAEEIDRYVGSKASDLKGSMVAAATTYSTADAAYAAFNAAVLKLRKNGVGPKIDIYADVSWSFFDLLKDKLIDIDTDNSDAVRRGAMKLFNGVYIRPSNLLYNDGSTYNMIRTVKAISFAMGMEEVKAYCPEKSMGDAIKGVCVYGAKITRPKEIAVIKEQ